MKSIIAFFLVFMVTCAFAECNRGPVEQKIADVLHLDSCVSPSKDQLLTIRKLNLDGLGISDLSALKKLENLYDLSLKNNQIDDISVLGKLTKLQKLSLDNNQISDITPLVGGGWFSFAKGARNLTYLSLNENQIDDITAISKLNGLLFLSLANNKLTDIGIFSSVRAKLNTLVLDGNLISDFSPLSKIGLYELSLNQTGIADLSPLASMKGLSYLSAKGNNIKNLDSLAPLRRLYELYLSNNVISDLSPLKTLSALGIIDLSANMISSINALSKHSGIHKFLISNNPIESNKTNINCPVAASSKVVAEYCLGGSVLENANYSNDIEEFKGQLQGLFIKSLENPHMAIDYDAIHSHAISIAGSSSDLCSIIESTLYDSNSGEYEGLEAQQCLDRFASTILKSRDSAFDTPISIAQDRLIIKFLAHLKRTSEGKSFRLLDFSKLKKYFARATRDLTNYGGDYFLQNFYELGIIFDRDSDLNEIFELCRWQGVERFPFYPVKESATEYKFTSSLELLFFLRLLSLEKYSVLPNHSGELYYFGGWYERWSDGKKLIHIRYANALLEILEWVKSNAGNMSDREIVQTIDSVNEILDSRTIVLDDDTMDDINSNVELVNKKGISNTSLIYDERREILERLLNEKPELKTLHYRSDMMLLLSDDKDAIPSTFNYDRFYSASRRTAFEMFKHLFANNLIDQFRMQHNGFMGHHLMYRYQDRSNFGEFKALLDQILVANEEYRPNVKRFSTIQELEDSYGSSLKEVRAKLKLITKDNKSYYRLGNKRKREIYFPAGVYFVDHDIEIIAKTVRFHPLALIYAPGRRVQIKADNVSDIFISVASYSNEKTCEANQRFFNLDGVLYGNFACIDGEAAGSISIEARKSIVGNNVLLAHGTTGCCVLGKMTVH